MSTWFKCPSGEIIMTRYNDINGDTKFIVTTKPSREYYYLYKEGSNSKLGKAKTPTELESKFDVINTIMKGSKHG